MTIIYRKFLPEESKAYRAIRLESLKEFPEAFGASYQDSLKTEKLRMEEDIEKQSQEKFVFGAFAGQELIGLCAFAKHEDHTGGIYQMYVNKEFQGKDIGLGLIQAVIHEANTLFNDIEIILEVTPNNEKACQFYKKIGFKEILKETINQDSEGNIIMKYAP